MSKFHIGKNGPATCKATKGKCPLGGESGSENHFNSLKEAETAFEKQNNGSLGKPLSKDFKIKESKDMKFKTNPEARLQYSNINELKNILQKIDNTEALHSDDYLKDLGINKESFRKDDSFRDEIIDKGEEPKYIVVDYDLENDEIVVQQPIEYSDVENNRVESNYESDNLNHFNNSNENLNKLPISKTLIENSKLNEDKLIYNEGYDEYYFDDNEGYNIEYRFRPSEELKENANNFSFKLKVAPLIERMKDEGIPDWASLPTDAVERNENKTKENLSPINKDAFDRINLNTKTKLKNLSERSESEKVIEDYKKEVKDIEEKLINNTDERSYGIIDLNSNQRKNYMERRKGLLNRISKLEDLTDYQKESAKRGLQVLENTKKEDETNLVIEALSNHYPAPDAKTRKVAAQKWVNEHPEIVNENSFKKLCKPVYTHNINRRDYGNLSSL